MFVHRIASTARKLFPEVMLTPLRRILTAILTPIEWSYLTGHFQSSIRGRAVDKTGKPLLWYTYPIIEFLNAIDFTDKRILEFGSGQSTLWWAERAAHVVAFENDPVWYRRIKQQVPANVTLHFVDAPSPSKEVCAASAPYDVIIIDGLERLECARISMDLLADDGAIVLDNSDGYWGGDGDRTYPIIDMLRDGGFSRIDFYGWCPAGIAPTCSSVFFKNRCFLLRGSNPPVRTVG